MRLQSLSVGAWVSCLASGVYAQGDPDCPDGRSLVEVQPEVIIGLQPISISTFIPSKTVLTVGGAVIAISNAPTMLVTDFTLTDTSTSFFTGSHPSPFRYGYNWDSHCGQPFWKLEW
ncbi:hypothetical protein QQZ08_005846 [Neonectria magnoliae]|uniref:Uncharacterized protein n=1 Tax=Neonectria magnoliae TaxID=2732573 RepID=A0ABR1I287_9HYPO